MNLIDDVTLLKMAEAEILKEAKLASIRNSVAGVSGWQPCPKPNKIFLTNTLLQTMTSNRLLTKKQRGKTEKKHKSTERKLLQKSSKTDMTTNFVYQKPKKNKEKPVGSAKSNKVNSNKNHSEDRQSTKTKKLIEKCNIKKINLKKSNGSFLVVRDARVHKSSSKTKSWYCLTVTPEKFCKKIFC